MHILHNTPPAHTLRVDGGTPEITSYVPTRHIEAETASPKITIIVEPAACDQKENGRLASA